MWLLIHVLNFDVGLDDPRLLPSLDVVTFSELDTSHVRFDYAVTSHTLSGFPYIDMVTSSVGVVIGGNGRSAKAADEFGHIAAK